MPTSVTGRVRDSNVRPVSISSIQREPRASNRIAIDPGTVGVFADLIRAGVTFPPITVWWDGDTYWLSDGLHRLTAAEQAGCAELLCEVHLGAQADVQGAICASDGTRRLASGSRDASAADTTDEIVARAIRYMRANLEPGLSVAKLARRVGVSAPHLRRRFREVKQLNPRALFTELRMERARELLDTKGLAVKDVAGRLGYKTVSAFGRAFIRIWGASPRASRRRKALAQLARVEARLTGNIDRPQE